ncbi:hypothetical protein [Alkaliphilus metalliredigens]|nr:hypothetical protein [Alkaliphilus metalliredigens]
MKYTEILDTDGNVIPGLYGAGRVYGNDTMGNVVFGKIAGKNAAGK